MSNKKYTFIANWKMYLAADQALLFARENKESFIDLANKTGHEIVLCPSIIDIQQVAAIFRDTPIKIGSQDCSDFEIGAYTGQVSVSSIKSSGASYGLVGHHERRLYNGETNEQVARKIMLLLDQGITPVLCIGESAEAHEQGKAVVVLEEQLALVLKGLHNPAYARRVMYLAYEPAWSIGTGKIPTPPELTTIFEWLYGHTKKAENVSWRLLYGGSVSENTINSFDQIPHLEGFLVGGASLNFQAFKKIVSYPSV